MENIKKFEKLKKIEALDAQLTSTISKIEEINKPIKIDKKKLSIFILITFSIAAFLTAIITFLVIDPFRWYTINYNTYIANRKTKIVEKFESYVMPNEFLLQEGEKTVKDLLDQIKKKPDLDQVFVSIGERFNYNTNISVYDSMRLLENKAILTDKIYQLKFNFVDYDIDIAITINIKVKISPF